MKKHLWIYPAILLIAIAFAAVSCCPVDQGGQSGDTPGQGAAPVAGDGAEANQPADETADTPSTGESPSADLDGDGLPDSVSHMASEDGGMTTTTDPGTGQSYTSTMGVPEGWPESVPMIEGMDVLMGNVSMIEAGTVMDVRLQGQLSRSEIEEFYTGLEGWSLDEDIEPADESENHVMFALIDEEGHRLEVYIDITEEMTHLGLTYFDIAEPSTTPE